MVVLAVVRSVRTVPPSASTHRIEQSSDSTVAASASCGLLMGRQKLLVMMKVYSRKLKYGDSLRPTINHVNLITVAAAVASIYVWFYSDNNHRNQAVAASPFAG